MLKINELRQSLGITQKQLADKIGVKNYIVANWEQGRTEPSVKDLIDLANFFECSVDYLLGRENDFGQITVVKNSQSEYAELISLYSELSESKRKAILDFIKQFN